MGFVGGVGVVVLGGGELRPKFKNRQIVYTFNGESKGMVTHVIYGMDAISYRVTWGDGTCGEYSGDELTESKVIE